MKSKHLVIALPVGAALMATSLPSMAAYTWLRSAPVSIQSLYVNEQGSPYVVFNGTPNVEANCNNNGMYLFDLGATLNLEHRRNKMAAALAAKMSGSRVIVEYYFDSNKIGWDRCYISAIEVID